MQIGGFTAGSLFASLAISSIGLALFGYGRKQARLPQLVVGLVLLIYPYFVPALVPMIIVAAALLGVMWLAIRLGH
jgi:hypothetical protein